MRGKNVFKNLLIAGGLAAAASSGCAEKEPVPQMEEIVEAMSQDTGKIEKISTEMKGYVKRNNKKAEDAAKERAAIGERIDGVQGEVTAARAEQATANEELGNKMQTGFDGITSAVEEVKTELAGVGAEVTLARSDINKANTRLDEAKTHREDLEKRLEQRTSIYDYNDNYRLVVKPITAEKDLISLFHNGNLIRKLEKMDAPSQGEMELELVSRTLPDKGESIQPHLRAGLYKGNQALEKSQEIDGYLEEAQAMAGQDLPTDILNSVFTEMPDLDSEGWNLFTS